MIFNVLKKIGLLGVLAAGVSGQASAEPMAGAPLACPTEAALNRVITSKTLPMEVYQRLAHCVEQGTPQSHRAGVRLLAYGAAQTFYDSYRVPDVTAHQAGAYLRRVVLDNPLAQDFKEDAFAILKDDQKRAELCRLTIKMPIPNYDPAYMVNHGMAAMSGAGSGVNKVAKPKDSWARAVAAYLSCPS
ncbi:MAG: hypothetical protein KA214_02590 [Neisseriaceae bacterium]|nr:hypothetical protein [Neisseriaceae bacterium]